MEEDDIIARRPNKARIIASVEDDNNIIVDGGEISDSDINYEAVDVNFLRRRPKFLLDAVQDKVK